jgi:hypothetical protein
MPTIKTSARGRERPHMIRVRHSPHNLTGVSYKCLNLTEVHSKPEASGFSRAPCVAIHQLSVQRPQVPAANSPVQSLARQRVPLASTPRP